MMSKKSIITSLVILIMMTVGLVARQQVTPLAHAQGDNEIQLNERKIGEINASNPQPTFTFTATANQEVTIDVTTITPQLAVSFSVLNQAGALLVAVGNPALQNQVSDTLIFPQPGTYTIQISNVSDVDGQFIVSVLEPTRVGPVEVLLIGESVNDSLVQGNDISYGFAANPQSPLQLNISAGTLDFGLDLSLQNSSGESIAFFSNKLIGGQLLIPAGTQNYVLRLINNHPNGVPISYTLNLSMTGQTISGGPDVTAPAATPPPVTQPTPTEDDGLPTLPTSGPCKLATQGQIVNVRAGPSIDYDQVTTIGAFTVYDVLGRNEDNSWLQIDAQPEIGWVSRAVTRQGGACGDNDLPSLDYPPLYSRLAGIVWHDLCAPPETPTNEPPTGCVEVDEDVYRANGMLDPGEPRIAGVRVDLATGVCPGTPVDDTLTGSGGQYAFENLTSGTYCVSVDANISPNNNLLIPGQWTAPVNTAGFAFYTVEVPPNSDVQRSFGWDFQFAP